ncbi:MAG: acyl-CoA thioesterase [Rhodocyclaceae bacterium]|nr:acyl-CoA thioesterase [Rhodocyclaceae bacterium]
MFVASRVVRVQHCDPSGIVFYPKYFLLFHEVVEQWMVEGLGVDYADFVLRSGYSLPMVKIECEFMAPSRVGDQITFELGVERLGVSSVTLSLRGHGNGQERVHASLLMVHTAVKDMRAEPIPDALREAMLRFALE